ncbi:hypothetical protein [Mesorhizobium sp. KR2-14]|uniref:hypothetical protein n=1 Tax=Mesorhizobium sp. KR2-14 TaxID=3156610 RepID=UPI0032B361F5
MQAHQSAPSIFAIEDSLILIIQNQTPSDLMDRSGAAVDFAMPYQLPGSAV